MSLFSKFYQVTMVTKALGIDTSEFTEPIKDYIEKVKNEFLVEVASNIEADTINDKITDNVVVDENLTSEDAAERQELVDNFKEVISTASDGKLNNITEAIDAEPEKWGQLLSDANITSDTLDSMSQSIENGESISGDLVNIAYGSVTSGLSSLSETYNAEIENSNTEATKSAETSTTTQNTDSYSSSVNIEDTTSTSNTTDDKSSTQQTDAEKAAARGARADAVLGVSDDTGIELEDTGNSLI